MILGKRIQEIDLNPQLLDLHSTKWIDHDGFKAILKTEVNRSFRTKQPLTHVLLRLFDKEIKIQKSKLQKYIKIIMTTISENSRSIDVLSIDNNYNINIILVDTALDGAKTYIEKTVNAIVFEFKAAGKTNFISMFKDCQYSSFPLNQIAGASKVEARPVLINNFELSSIKKSEKTHLLLNEQQKVYIDWNIKANPDSTISIGHSQNIIEYFIGNKEYVFNFIKRLFDIVFSIVSLSFLLPVLFFIGAIIKLTSEGPVLFRQERVGQGGKKFTFLKFRSMYFNNNDSIHKEYVEDLISGDDENTNNGDTEEPVYKITNDPRITPIGAFLRKTSLDELPQFINVLIGDMSVVGPRPPIPYEVDVYKLWHLQRVLEVKPGITGMWQVYGRSSTTFNEMVRMDLNYVRNRSLILDIKLILLTITSVFKGRGAM